MFTLFALVVLAHALIWLLTSLVLLQKQGRVRFWYWPSSSIRRAWVWFRHEDGRISQVPPEPTKPNA